MLKAGKLFFHLIIVIMDYLSIIKNLSEILEKNPLLTTEQKKAIEEAKRKAKAQMTRDELIELIQLLGTILTVAHSSGLI